MQRFRHVQHGAGLQFDQSADFRLYRRELESLGHMHGCRWGHSPGSTDECWPLVLNLQTSVISKLGEELHYHLQH